MNGPVTGLVKTSFFSRRSRVSIRYYPRTLRSRIPVEGPRTILCIPQKKNSIHSHRHALLMPQWINPSIQFRSLLRLGLFKLTFASISTSVWAYKNPRPKYTYAYSTSPDPSQVYPSDEAVRSLFSESGSMLEKSFLDEKFDEKLAVGPSEEPLSTSPDLNATKNEQRRLIESWTSRSALPMPQQKVDVPFSVYIEQVRTFVDKSRWTDLNNYLYDKSVLKDQNGEITDTTTTGTTTAGTTTTGTTVVELVKVLHRNRQFLACLYMFLEFENTSYGQDIKFVAYAINAAYKAEYHELCGDIFDKYSSTYDFSIQTLETVLENFIANYNVTEARSFFEQISTIARDETVLRYIDKVVKIAKNPLELEDFFWYWRARQLTPTSMFNSSIWAAFLFGLKHLEAGDGYRRVLRALPRDQKVVLKALALENALITEDWSTSRSLISEAQDMGRQAFDIRIFGRSLRYFSYLGNSEAITNTIELMISAGHTLSSQVLDEVGLGHSSRPDFDAVKFLNSWHNFGLVGTGKTMRWLLNHLMAKYGPNSGPLRKSILRTLRNCPNLSKRMNVSNLGGNIGTDAVIAPLNPRSTWAAIKSVQHLVKQGKAQKSIEVLDDLLRRRICPPKAVFYVIIRGMHSEGLTGNESRVIELMRQSGYDVENDEQLQFLKLMGSSSYSTIDNTQKAALLYKFFKDNGEYCDLELLTLIGQELARAGHPELGLEVIDSKRAGQPFSLDNHDSFSITALIKILQSQKRLNEVGFLVQAVLSDGFAGYFTKPFFMALKSCYKQSLAHENEAAAEHLLKVIEQANAHNDAFLEQSKVYVTSLQGILLAWELSLSGGGDMDS